MKILREKYDYDAIDPIDLSENIDVDFKTILDEEENANNLLEELENTLDKCTYLSNKDIERCKSKINDIKATHKILVEQIKEK